MNRLRPLAVSLAGLAAAGAMAACTSSDNDTSASSSQPPPATTSSPAPSTSVVTTTTDTTVPASTSRPASSTPSDGQCAESQLRASVKNDDVAGVNSHVVRVSFVNKSTSECTLTGYPGAAIADSSGKQVQQAKRVSGGAIGGTIEKPRTVTVRPRASAYAYLEGTSTRKPGTAQAGCDAPKYPRILVTPPNTETAVPFTIGWPQCYTFQIHPVRID